MYILDFSSPNSKYSNNLVNRRKYPLILVPLLSLIQYFFWNYENLYFLILSLFQISTAKYFNLLPSHYCPTGPWATAVPLLLCVFIEIVRDIYNWFRQYYIDSQENNNPILVLEKNQWKYLPNSRIRPGNIIYIRKNDIIPVDGIAIGDYCNFNTNITTVSPNNEIKISLSPLNGESGVISIDFPIQEPNLKKYQDCQLSILDFGGNLLNQFSGFLYFSNQDIPKIPINGNNFIPAGSILKSDGVCIWATTCGNNKKCFSHRKVENTKKNTIDNILIEYMMSVNVTILIGKVLFISLISFYAKPLKTLPQNNMSNILVQFLERIIQNWMVFNGVIPFSVKIFLLLIRSYQKYLFSDDSIIISNSTIIDDICLSKKIVSDKTGTITKNEMEFSKVIYPGSNIIDVDNIYNRESLHQQKNLLRCLGICIHIEEEKFKTPEDRTIRSKYIYLDCKVKQTDNKIELQLPIYPLIKSDIQHLIEIWKYIPIKGLEFTHTKNISSKIVKDSIGLYYIFSKGSLPELKKRVLFPDIDKITNCDLEISSKYPSLRVMACGFRKLKEKEVLYLNQLTGIPNNYDFEVDLNFLGLIGIRDNVQEGVLDTIKTLNKARIYTSICTGDREITALAIAKEIGIYNSKREILHIGQNFIENMDDNLNNNNLNDKILLISGQRLQDIIEDKYLTKQFQYMLVNSRSFIAYSLIPELKRKLVEFLEKQGCKTLAIGDGFNDIDMIRNANTGVAIRNFNNKNVTNEADVILEKFHNLKNLILVRSRYSYIRNSTISKIIFYKCVMISFTLMTYIILNNGDTSISIFDGIIIQGFNIIWTVLPSLYYSLYYRDLDKADIYKYPQRHLELSSNKYLNHSIISIWIFTSIINSITSISICFYFNSETAILRYNTGLCIICIVYNRLFFIESSNMSPMNTYYMSCLSMLNISSYILFMNWYLPNSSEYIYSYQNYIMISSIIGISFILDYMSHILIKKLF